MSIELSDYNTFTTLVDRHILKEETYEKFICRETHQRNTQAASVISSSIVTLERPALDSMRTTIMSD